MPEEFSFHQTQLSNAKNAMTEFAALRRYHGKTPAQVATLITDALCGEATAQVFHPVRKYFLAISAAAVRSQTENKNKTAPGRKQQNNYDNNIAT